MQSFSRFRDGQIQANVASFAQVFSTRIARCVQRYAFPFDFISVGQNNLSRADLNSIVNNFLRAKFLREIPGRHQSSQRSVSQNDGFLLRLEKAGKPFSCAASPTIDQNKE